MQEEEEEEEKNQHTREHDGAKRTHHSSICGGFNYAIYAFKTM